MCHSDQVLRRFKAAQAGFLNAKELLPAIPDDHHQAMPPPPTNYQRKNFRNGNTTPAQSGLGLLRFQNSNSDPSEFLASQRKHIKNQVYESDVRKATDTATAGYTELDIALLEFVLASH
jgi:hypothetical protein